MKHFFTHKSYRDVLYTYGGSVINGAALFLINVIIARSVEEAAFAIFSLSLLALTTVAEMSDLGLNGGITRFAPYYIEHKQEGKLKQLLKTIWRWRVWLSLVLTVGGIMFAAPIAEYLFGNPVLTPYFQLSFLGIGGVVLLGFVSTYLKAAQRFAYNAWLQSWKGIFRFAAIIVLVLLGIENMFILLSVYIVVPWILFVATYHVLPKKFQHVSIAPEEKTALHKQLAKFSFWLTIWSLSAILASRVDQVMLSSLLSLEDVALYAVAFQFVYLYGLLQQSISAVLMPKASALATAQAVRSLIGRVFRLIVPLIALLLAVVFVSQYLFPFIFGSRYDASIPVYLVLSSAMVIGFIQIPYAFVSTIYNRTDLIAFSGFIQLAANIILNFYFIPQYGVMGAAYTFGIGIALSVVYNAVVAEYLLRRGKIQVV